jgi:hypothetical protein
MNFSSSREKISETKCASIFLKVGSKVSHENTGKKVGLRQKDILKFNPCEHSAYISIIMPGSLLKLICLLKE